MIGSSLALNQDDAFTWEEYRLWPDGGRWELLHGAAFAMSPGPSPRHQDISAEMLSLFRQYFKGKACRPFAAPLDVKLSERDVVQPDLLVVCDPAQIKDTHVEGAPRLVVEIVSPASESRDRLQKMKLYEKHGVDEYWIVTPYPPLVEIYLRQEASGLLHPHSGGSLGDKLCSPSFPGLRVDLDDVFDTPYSSEEREAFDVREGPSRRGPPSGASV